MASRSARWVAEPFEVLTPRRPLVARCRRPRPHPLIDEQNADHGGLSGRLSERIFNFIELDQ